MSDRIQGIRRLIKVYGPVRDPRNIRRLERQARGGQRRPHAGIQTSVKPRINGEIGVDSEEKHWWRVEYEIPPLRAIYTVISGRGTEQEIRDLVKLEQPLWRIRKLTIETNNPPQ